MKRAIYFYFMVIATVGIFGPTHSWSSTSAVTAEQNQQIIREFVAAWSRLDADELVTYFTADGTYYNMPIAPVSGEENLREFIGNFLQSWDKTDWEILNIMAHGDVVFVERIDRTVVAGRQVDLPCVGVFEMENGKIKMWRDYFDMATFTNAVQPSQDAP